MRKFLFTSALCLIAIIAGVINLFILNEPSPVLAWGGISVTVISGGITLHDVQATKKKRKAAADRERQRIAAEAETSRLEDGLELLQGKDWAAEVTIDKINKELGLEDPDDDFFDPEYTIVAGGVYADDIQPPEVAEFPESNVCGDCGDHHDEWMGCLPHALNVIHEFVDNKESDERLSQQKPQTAAEALEQIMAERATLAAERAELAADNMRTFEEESAVSIIDLGLLLAETEAKVNVLKDRINKDLW